MRAFYKKYNKIIVRSFKIWLPFFLIALSPVLFFLVKYNFYLFIGALIAACFIYMGVFAYINFNASMKDPIFKLIFRNMNKIGDEFNQKLSFNHVYYLNDEMVFDNLYFSFKPEDSFITNYFYGKDGRTSYSFFNISNDENKGYVLTVEDSAFDEMNDRERLYICCKKYAINRNVLKERHLIKVDETSRFDIYGQNENISLNSYIKARLDLLVPDTSSTIRCIVWSKNKMVYYIDKCSPFYPNDKLEREDQDKMAIAEIKKIRKQLCGMEIIVSCDIDKYIKREKTDV